MGRVYLYFRGVRLANATGSGIYTADGTIYKEALTAYKDLADHASQEIWHRGQIINEQGLRVDEEVAVHARQTAEWEAKFRKQEEEAKMLKANLLRAEVAKERGEGEAKKLVEQKDKWERLAKMKEEKEELEDNLRQQLREVKLAAKGGPTTTAATQTQQTPPLQRNLACQPEKPTYASVAVQAEPKEKGKAVGSASTPVGSASPAKGIIMKDMKTCLITRRR